MKMVGQLGAIQSRVMMMMRMLPQLRAVLLVHHGRRRSRRCRGGGVLGRSRSRKRKIRAAAAAGSGVDVVLVRRRREVVDGRRVAVAAVRRRAVLHESGDAVERVTAAGGTRQTRRHR